MRRCPHLFSVQRCLVLSALAGGLLAACIPQTSGEPRCGSGKEGTSCQSATGDGGSTVTGDGGSTLNGDGGCGVSPPGWGGGSDAGIPVSPPDGGSDAGLPVSSPDGGSDAGLPVSSPDGGSDAGLPVSSPDGGSDAGIPVSSPDGGSGSGGSFFPQDGGVATTPSDGGTYVYGVLSGILTSAGSPYHVVGDAQQVVTVPKGQVLTVGPGVVLDFIGDPALTAADTSGDEVMQHQAGRVEVKVYGRLVVQGTAAQPALLTSTNPYGWWGINFFGEDSVGDGDPVFDYMIYEKVRKNQYNGDREFTRGALWVYYTGGAVVVTHSVFRDNLAADCGALDLMLTQGSRVEGNLFENNRTSEIDRFGTSDSTATVGGGAMCITHGRDSVVKGNRFVGNRLESFRGYTWAGLVPKPFVPFPAPSGFVDLGGGGALHYYQPSNDLIEDNLFQGNEVLLGPGAALYFEDVPSAGITALRNQFLDNRAGSGAVITCVHAGGPAPHLRLDSNVFSGNLVDGATAPAVSGDCGL